MSIVLFFLIMQALHFACTARLYALAGEKAWKAAVPIYSSVVLMRIVQRPWWWVILLYIPVVGNVMALVVWSDTCRAFGFRRIWEVVLTLATLGVFLAYVAYSGRAKYDAKYREHRHALDSSILGAVVFATVAASLIKAFTYEAYTIPTSSMESSMMVGDFLFVNKMSYGTRIAITPLSFPLVHDTIPLLNTRSYVKGIHLPYLRLPALRKIKRGDIVVFNWPGDDASKPIDKRANYIKRCVALPGDTLEIRRGELSINGQPWVWNTRARPQKEYRLTFPRTYYEPFRQLLRMGLELSYLDTDAAGNEVVQAYLSDENLEKVRAAFPSVTAERLVLEPDAPESYPLFPLNARYNRDNYGPIYMPRRGDRIRLTETNLPQYRDIIVKYEGHTLETNERGEILIDGQPTETYTVAQDYYFMLGDNRDNSLDSRYWGYVPADHIVGSPAMIWLSITPDDGSGTPLFKRIRSERVFSFPQGQDGPLRSYFWPIAIAACILYGGYEWGRKRRKKRAEKDAKKP